MNEDKIFTWTLTSGGRSAGLRQSNLKLISHSLKKTEGVATMVSTPSRPLLAPTCQYCNSASVLCFVKCFVSIWLGFQDLISQVLEANIRTRVNKFAQGCEVDSIFNWHSNTNKWWLRPTWPCTQVQFVSSSFHLMPIWNSNLPLEVLCKKGEKRYSHRLSRKKAFWSTFVFFCLRLAPRYISWPSELRYSGIIRSEMEAAVSFWKSFWTFLNTRSMSRSFLLIWLRRCFMYIPMWVPVRVSFSSNAFILAMVP